MRKKRDAPEATFADAPATSRLSPMEIQQKEFGVTRVGGGYRMRDVDEFLDEITNSMTALVEENRRLKEVAGSGAMIGAPDLEEVSRQADEIIRRARDEAAQILRDARTSQPSAPVSGDPAADRAAISAFLGREREFLQSLAGLVQGHAESIKGMARDARDAAVAATAPPPPAPRQAAPPVAAPPPGSAATAAPAVAQPEPERAEPERAEPELVAPPQPTPPPQPAPREEPIRVDAPSREPEAEASPVPASTDRPTEAMEEPVRVDEPEPATVGRAEAEDAPAEEGDRSLRELFWGED